MLESVAPHGFAYRDGLMSPAQATGLVGYSAGALIARYFVEDSPDYGVTKVIQVCAPNGGSGWGKLTAGVRQSQEPRDGDTRGRSPGDRARHASS